MNLRNYFRLPASGFRLLKSFGLGVLTTLSLPPVGAFFVLLLSVPGIIRLTQQSATKREAFLTGWAFGCGYFIFGLYWVSVSLFVDIQSFWWVLPLSAVVGPALLALYYGFIPLLAWRYRAHDAPYALIFSAAWALIEWIRGHALTGFPWNLPGYAWHHVLSVMQINAALGIYGLTLLTLLWAAIPAFIAHRKIAAILVVSFLLTAAGGIMRLHQHPPQTSSEYTVRIVQPNIPQSLKWSREEMQNNFQRLLEMTSQPTTLKQPVTFVVWPETAVLADLQKLPDIVQEIGARLPRHSTALVGAMRITESGQYYNSVSALNAQTGVLDTYDKHHLVPFGEYIPFRRYLNLTPLAAGVAKVGDFTPGEGIATLRLGSLPKPSPLICYEAIFPGEVARRDDRPDWLVNVTNDAWYGKTAGPHQHFEIARVRAIEEGLPLVRAANTGISATVDALGRIIGIKGLEETGIVDTLLPSALPTTLYARSGDALFFLMLVLLAIAGEAMRPCR